MAHYCCCIDLEGMMKGDKVCIRVLGNPLPFAVGDAQVTHLTVVTYGELWFKAPSFFFLF